MICSYLSKDGTTIPFDLDSVTDIALGYSGFHPTWTATLIYVWENKAFVELRSSPADIRGNSSTEEVEEVDEHYIIENFKLSINQISAIRRAPKGWSLLDLR